MLKRRSSFQTGGDVSKTVASFKEDLGPNEEWLRSKQNDAVRGGRNEFGVPKRMGSITGSFSRPLQLPTYVLGVLKGEQGEQTRIRQESLDYLRKNWDSVKHEPIYIEVDPFGIAWVNEGNHRIMVARELGEKTLPVEVRYFSGGQKKAGPFEPEELLKLDEKASKVSSNSKPVRAAGKAGLMAAALGGAGGASAAEIAESFLPLGMTPSTLAPGTLTPEQKAASDEAYRRKLAEERAAKMKAQALLRSGVKQEEPQMAKGGMMARNIPGFQEGGANVDPVSGNEVPTGSMPEEVRDDIDAKLSPGEFVLPADVVRFIGLERLMKMRDEAKKGLQRMSDIGQMGNADEVGEASNGTYEDAGFESEIDDILSEIEAEENGRDVNEQTEVMMAQGGFMKSGTDLTKAPKNPVFDVRYYKNAEGSVMYITHINGKPMTPIPEGYKAVTQEEAQKVGQKAEEAAKAVQTTNESGGYDATQLDPSVADFLDEEARQQAKFDEQGRSKEGPREKRMGKVSNVMETIAKWATPYGTVRNVMDFLKGPQRTDEEAKQIPIEQRTGVAAQDIRAQDAAATAYQAAINSGMDAEYASQAARGAAQGVNSGMSPEDAAKVAVEAVQDVIDREGVPVSVATPSTASSSRSMAGAGSSFAVSPPSVAATSPVSDSGGSITSTDLGFGTGVDYGSEDLGSFLAKGGLVNKRQYPSKKKRGKGIASAKA
jgi:Arc/MetJ-type ribon-helix-helix transcriptional regulator